MSKMPPEEFRKLRMEVVFSDLEFLPPPVQSVLFDMYNNAIMPQIEAAMKAKPDELFEMLGRALSMRNEGIASAENIAFGQVRQFISGQNKDLGDLATRLRNDGHAGEILRSAIKGEDINESISLAQIHRTAVFLVGHLRDVIPEAIKTQKTASDVLLNHDLSKAFAFDESYLMRATDVLNGLRTARKLTTVAQLMHQDGNTAVSGLFDRVAHSLWHRSLMELNGICREQGLSAFSLSHPPALKI